MYQKKHLPDLERERYYKKLTLRNTLLTLLLFVTPFSLLFFIANHQISTLIKNQIYSRLSETVEENIKTITTFLNDRKIDLRSYAHLDIQNIQQTSPYSRLLKSLIQDKKWYDFLIIADLKGEIVVSINQEIEGNIADRKYFQISKQGKAYNSGIFFSDILNRPVMILSQPLRNRENEVNHLPVEIRNYKRSPGIKMISEMSSKNNFLTLAQLEKQYIQKVLEYTNYNKTQTAKILGIHPASLFRKLKTWE